MSGLGFTSKNGAIFSQISCPRFSKISSRYSRIAAMKYIKEDFKITREHGVWFEKEGIQRIALFHPAALLRDPRRRPETFEDLKTIQAKIREICERTY